jgi:hypothetical protein
LQGNTLAALALVVSALAGVGTIYNAFWATDRAVQVQLKQLESADRALQKQISATERMRQQQWEAAENVRRETTARELLSDAASILALKEAWILQGPGSELAKITDVPVLEGAQVGQTDGLWLRQVEIRAILDEASWNSPTDQSFGFIEHRRVWIARYEVKPDQPLAMASPKTKIHFPALISSRGRGELCNWIERVAIAHDADTLSDAGLAVLRPLLVSVAQEDRVAILKATLSPRAQAFLAQIRARWGNKANWD